MSSVLFIVNPAGRGGTGASTWAAFQTLWPGRIEQGNVIVTERPEQTREIAATSRGYDILAVVGGDGTVSDVMTGIMNRPDAKPTLAIIPAGTGNDIARNAGIRTVKDAVDTLQSGSPRAFDLIRSDFQLDGKPACRYAFLGVGVGFSPIPMIKPWMKRLLGPRGVYYLGMLLAIIAHRPPLITVRVDGHEHSSGLSWMVVVGNVEYASGGTMRIAPGALTDDGELNVTVFPVKPKLRMITKVLPAVATGAHIQEPGVSYFTARKVEVDADPPAILDQDGDVHGTTPATFTVCPRVIEILTP